MSKQHTKMDPFICHGVELSEGESGNWYGDCPFCGKEDHFFVNEKTGQFDCKVCGVTGNIITFLGKIADQLHAAMTAEQWKTLSELRKGIPAEAYQRYKIGWNGREYLIPIYSEKGTVRDIRRYDGQKTMSTTGCHLQLFGLQELAKAPKGSTVWLCEGEWDAMALRWLLDRAGFKDHVVVGVPGAMTFKDEWCKWFSGHNVRICYDNDNAGDDGSMKAGRMLKGEAKTLKYLCWPETRPDGWDLNDFVSWGMGKRLKAQSGIGMLVQMLADRHRRAETLPPEDPMAPGPSGEDQTPCTFGEVLEVFKKWVLMTDDFEEALAVSLAVCLGNDVPGDPIWVYLVGPPGSGKTLILLSLQHSTRTVFRSTLTPASLVSGFNVHPDPSLLPKLDGKTAVFKDGTEVLAMHPDARRETYSVLRGAFDGHVMKSFGNGVNREYKLQFNMLIGMTPAVHGDSNATMGERFLKFEIKDDAVIMDQKIRAAMMNISKEVEMGNELAGICNRFLLNVVDPTQLPDIQENYIEGIVALAQLTAMLRAQVEREQHGDRDLRYRPTYETGTRLAKQLAKLGQMLTYVFGVKAIDRSIYKILKRIAYDTSIGFHMDIVRALVGKKDGLTREEIGRQAKIPTTTLLRRLQDMEQLGLVEKGVPLVGVKVGPAPSRWVLSQLMTKLWTQAEGPAEKPVNGHAPAKPAGVALDRLKPLAGPRPQIRK